MENPADFVEARIHRAIVENTQMAIACFDRELRIQYVNPFAAHLYNSVPGEIIGKTPRELNLPEPLLSLIEQRLRGIFQTKNCDIFEFEWTFLPETRHFEIHCIPEYDQTRQITFLCTISYDVTKRKQAENALRQSEELYRTLAHHFPNGAVALFDRDLRFLLVDGERMALSGLGELKNKTLWEVFPSELCAILEPRYRATLMGESLVGEDNYGEYVYQYRSAPIRNEAGEIIYGMIVMQNVTERRRMEDALRQSERLYHLLAANFPNGAVYLIDSDLHFTLAEGRIFEELGLINENFIGKGIGEVFSPEIGQTFDEILRSAINGEPTTVFTEFHNRSFRNQIVPVSDEAVGAVKVMIVSQDITEEKRIEEVMREQERLKISFQKEKEFSQLISRTMTLIAHEFRTPLAIMLTSSELLDHYLDRMTDEKRRHHTDTIKEQVEHLTDTMSDISLILQGQSHHPIVRPSTFDLESLYREITQNIRDSHSAGHTFEFNSDHSLQEFTADRRLMTALLMHLLTNAVKYSKADTIIRIDLFSENEQIILRVSDQGIGIPTEDRPRIFEPFYRGSNIGAIGGTGLGLTIVQEAVDLLGGIVTIESVLDRGTTFTVYLPVTPLPAT